jgi:hypothetical protein
MRKYQNIEIKQTENVLVEVICDKCGDQIRINGRNSFNFEWLEFSVPDIYQELEKHFEIDLSEKCSKKAIGILRKAGYPIIKHNYSHEYISD